MHIRWLNFDAVILILVMHYNLMTSDQRGRARRIADHNHRHRPALISPWTYRRPGMFLKQCTVIHTMLFKVLASCYLTITCFLTADLILTNQSSPDDSHMFIRPGIGHDGARVRLGADTHHLPQRRLRHGRRGVGGGDLVGAPRGGTARPPLAADPPDHAAAEAPAPHGEPTHHDGEPKFGAEVRSKA